MDWGSEGHFGEVDVMIVFREGAVGEAVNDPTTMGIEGTRLVVIDGKNLVSLGDQKLVRRPVLIAMDC